MRHHKIEIDDDVFKYLKEHAGPFIDTPNSVLRRLIFTDVPPIRLKENLSPDKIFLPPKNNSRKERDLRLENTLKTSVGKFLQARWGKFNMRGQSLLLFPERGIRVVCKYSRCSDREVRWFWGVSKNSE